MNAWLAIAKSAHPIKVALIEAMAYLEEPVSPTLLAEVLEVDLARVSYHMTWMLGREVVELVSTHTRRGALEHKYRLVES